MASGLVSYDKRLENIFQNLLGVTAVFDTVDNANKAARALHYQVRLVTLDGTEIRPGGSFSGGANRQNNTTFIKPELENLIAELNELQASQIKQEKHVQSLQETLRANKEQLATLKAQGEEARFAEQKAELEYQQLAERLNDVNQLCKQLEENGTEHSSNDLEAQKAHFEAELTTIAERKQELTSEIEQIKANKNSITQKVDNLRQQLSQAKLQERELLSERKFESANKTRLEISLAENKSEIAKCEELLAFHASDNQVENLPALQKQHDEAIERKASEEERLVSLRFELEDCEANLEELEEQVAKENQKNEELIRKQAQIEAQVSQISERLRGFSNDLTEDYHMTLDEAKEASQVVENMEAARERLQELRRRIKALGPINLDAISQYDEVNERLKFLNGQKEDLVHSKNLLLDTINEMDDEVKSRFQVTFNAIRESFKETFKQMFGGGSADLSLTEGDLLTAGIEISVQPPGKKIQSLNLMSGGEKALSALALLFAIIRVKTIPFVILDEVEAATGHKAAHTVETGGHRRTVGNENTHTHHAYLATRSSSQSREFADGTSLAFSSRQLFMHDLLLVHDEEYGIFPPVVPGHKEIGHIANNEEDGNEQQENTRGIPNVNEPEVAPTATNQQNEQPDYAETDNQYPIDVEENTRIGEHGHIEHPAVLTIGTQHGMCACHVVVVILLFLCHRVIIVILMQKY